MIDEASVGEAAALQTSVKQRFSAKPLDDAVLSLEHLEYVIRQLKVIYLHRMAYSDMSVYE